MCGTDFGPDAVSDFYCSEKCQQLWYNRIAATPSGYTSRRRRPGAGLRLDEPTGTGLIYRRWCGWCRRRTPAAGKRINCLICGQRWEEAVASTVWLDGQDVQLRLEAGDVTATHTLPGGHLAAALDPGDLANNVWLGLERQLGVYDH